MTIIHPVDMAKPTKTALGEQGEHAGYSRFLKDDCVGIAVLPSNTQDLPQVAQMEGVKSMFLTGIEGPRLASIEQSA